MTHTCMHACLHSYMGNRRLPASLPEPGVRRPSPRERASARLFCVRGLPLCEGADGAPSTLRLRSSHVHEMLTWTWSRSTAVGLHLLCNHTGSPSPWPQLHGEFPRCDRAPTAVPLRLVTSIAALDGTRTALSRRSSSLCASHIPYGMPWHTAPPADACLLNSFIFSLSFHVSTAGVFVRGDVETSVVVVPRDRCPTSVGCYTQPSLVWACAMISHNLPPEMCCAAQPCLHACSSAADHTDVDTPAQVRQGDLSRQQPAAV